MALDTQRKRMSAAGAGRIWKRAVFPDAAKGEEWRIGIGSGYGGNTLAPPPVVPVGFLTGAKHIAPFVS